MTQRTRKVSVRGNSDGQQYIDLPVQYHQVSREGTYSSVDVELQHQLERQVMHWKAEYQHAQSHLDRFQEIMGKYNRTLNQKAQLEKKCKQSEYQIQNLRCEILAKADELTDYQRKKKHEQQHLLKKHNRQIQKLKRDIQKLVQEKETLENDLKESQSKTNSEHKKRRDIQRQMNKSNSQMVAQLATLKDSIEMYKLEINNLKRKHQDAMSHRQSPAQKNMYLNSQIQIIHARLKAAEDQVLKDKQTIHKLQLVLMSKQQQSMTLERQLSKEKLQNQSEVRKLISEIGRLKTIQDQLTSFQKQNGKLKSIILTKNQQINVLLYKAQTAKKLQNRYQEDGDKQYKDEVKKLQKQLQQKFRKHTKQREVWEGKVKELQLHQEVMIIDKNKVIQQKDSIIESLMKDLGQLKQICNTNLYRTEEDNIKNLELVKLLRRNLQQKQEELAELKQILLKIEDKVRFLQGQRELMIEDQRSSQIKYSKIIRQLQEVSVNGYQQNYESSIQKAQLQQLYEAKLSSKDELIQLLRLKLKNYDCGDFEWMYKTGTSFYR